MTQEELYIEEVINAMSNLMDMNEDYVSTEDIITDVEMFNPYKD